MSVERPPRVRPRPALLPSALCLGVSLAAGCGDDGGGGGTATPDAGPPRPAVRLLVDSNRDGRVDETDFDGRGQWTNERGAVFLANMDDDDEDHAVDAADQEVNGDADAADLARVRVPAWMAAPTGATGRLTLEASSAPAVRLFLLRDGQWTRFNPQGDTLGDAQLRAGVELGIESTDFPTATWNGQVTLRLRVEREGMMLGEDSAVLRVAPFVLSHSLEPTERVYGPTARGVLAVQTFHNDLDRAMQESGMEFVAIDTMNRTYRPDNERGPDVWIQDIMEFGWTAMPSADGRHGMQVVMRAATQRRPQALWTEREFLGPDRGYVWKYATASQNGRVHDPSLDSTGNLEVIPPYRSAERNYPHGRILHGWTAARGSDVNARAFMAAQNVQGPIYQIDTSWLLVGHVDEFISFIPAETPRGWKMLVASPRAARALLTEYARGPGNADRLMFEGQRWYYPEGHEREGQSYPAQRPVREVLADARLMAFNQQDQARIDVQREALVRELRLNPDEVIEIPVLMWEIEGGRGAAYTPGTINLLYYNRHVVAAVPHGPWEATGGDPIENDFVERLRPYGITVHFAEQWDVLHASLGEVHCGTNALRSIPSGAQSRWWEAVR